MQKRYRKSGCTIHDIARLAGVSTGTVSKALNNTDRVSPETRDRVRAVARQLNWQANQLARGLVLRRSHLIGLVVSSITNDFCAQLYDGAETYAASRGYSLLLCVTEDEPAREASALKRLTDAVHADGVIAIPSPAPAAHSPFYEMFASHYPFVLVSRRFADLPSSYVVCADVEGGKMATDHLLGLGHRRIAYVYDAGQANCTNVLDRRAGYQRALEEAGVAFDPCLCAGVHLHSAPEDHAALRNMIEAQHPTAIFAHNDRTAVAVLQWLDWAGIEVPAQMALVGFGNLNLSSIVTPPLTTFEYGIREIGSLAAKALIDGLEGEAAEPHQEPRLHHDLPRLLVRRSCGANL